MTRRASLADQQGAEDADQDALWACAISHDRSLAASTHSVGGPCPTCGLPLFRVTAALAAAAWAEARGEAGKPRSGDEVIVIDDPAPSESPGAMSPSLRQSFADFVRTIMDGPPEMRAHMIENDPYRGHIEMITRNIACRIDMDGRANPGQELCDCPAKTCRARTMGLLR